MSNTRRSETGEFNQERFCSSPEYETGLRAYEVAKRAQLLTAGERELVLWLQAESHKPGGLAVVAAEFLEVARKDIGCGLMFALGVHTPATILGAEEVKRLRLEVEGDMSMPQDEFGGLGSTTLNVPSNFYAGAFPLRGETRAFSYRTAQRKHGREFYGVEREQKDDAVYPKTYQGGAFVEFCLSTVRPHLESNLRNYCLDPASSFPEYRLFPKLRIALLAFMRSRRNASFVETAIATELFRALHEARRASLTLIAGMEGRGKSTAAKEWCERNSGTARYVRVPATSDDISFYRSIAKALGVSSALSLKGVQMRERIEYVLQTTKLMLVCDCAEYVWPQNNRREALPNRLNWLVNALVEVGAPVALIANPQFDADQRIVEVKTGWSPALFLSLLTRRVLPAEMSEADVSAVVRSCLPEASDTAVAAIVEYVSSTGKCSGGIEQVVKAARAIAENDTRQKVTSADVGKALKERIMPSDRAIAEAMQPACKRRAKVQQNEQGVGTRYGFAADPQPHATERNSSATESQSSARLTDLEALGVRVGGP